MRIWDSVLVNDELDLLELRLRTLDSIVDMFVVVEADRTFRGAEKPLHVSEASDRFAPWAHKIRLVTAHLSEPQAAAGAASHSKADVALAQPSSQTAALAWAREHEQERAQLPALVDVAMDDLVVLGDVDEIPTPAAVKWAASRHDLNGVRLVMRQACYRANWEWPQLWFDGPLAVRGRALTTHPMAGVMLGQGNGHLEGYKEDELHGAGWHFTSLGSAEDVRRKLEAYSHVEESERLSASITMMAVAQRARIQHLGRGRLHTLSEVELSDSQEALLALRPDFFDFSSPPSSWLSNGYSFAATLDQKGWLPQRLAASWQRESLPAIAVATMAAAESVRIMRRRLRPDPWVWKRGATWQLPDSL